MLQLVPFGDTQLNLTHTCRIQKGSMLSARRVAVGCFYYEQVHTLICFAIICKGAYFAFL